MGECLCDTPFFACREHRVGSPIDPRDADDTTTDNQVGMLLFEVFTALEGLGGEYDQDSQRIAAASTTLGKASAERVSNPGQFQIDLNSLLAQLNSLQRDHGNSTPLATAIDAVETLLGTWSGNDYV